MCALERVPLLLLAMAGATLAGEAPITLTSSASYQTLSLPLALRSRARSAELRDLQVINGAGESLPYAWVPVPEPTPQAQLRWQAAPFFKADSSATTAASAAEAAQQGAWVIDLRRVEGALTRLSLDIKPDAQGVYGFALEHSADLQTWRSLSAEAQLLQLQQNGLRLAHTKFELGGQRGGYLRLRALKGQAPLPLTAVRVQSSQQFSPLPALQWSEPIAPHQCTPDYCDYTLPRHLPADRLAWQLAAANTLAPIQVLGQYDYQANSEGQAPTHKRHGLRAQLRQLREKSSPPPSAPALAEPWVSISQTSVYWLRMPEGDVQSPPIELDGYLPSRIRLQPQGGMAMLGSKPPLLRLATREAQLVFLAREPAPFRLRWGGDDAPAVLALNELVPGRRSGDPLPSETAHLELPLPVPAPSVASAAASVASPTPAAPAQSGPRWGLWAALLAALAVMGAMAYSLLSPKAPKPEGS